MLCVNPPYFIVFILFLFLVCFSVSVKHIRSPHAGNLQHKYICSALLKSSGSSNVFLYKASILLTALPGNCELFQTPCHGAIRKSDLALWHSTGPWRLPGLHLLRGVAVVFVACDQLNIAFLSYRVTQSMCGDACCRCTDVFRIVMCNCYRFWRVIDMLRRAGSKPEVHYRSGHERSTPGPCVRAWTPCGRTGTCEPLVNASGCCSVSRNGDDRRSFMTNTEDFPLEEFSSDEWNSNKEAKRTATDGLEEQMEWVLANWHRRGFSLFLFVWVSLWKRPTSI